MYSIYFHQIYSLITYWLIALNDESEVSKYVGLQQLEKLFEALGTEKDTVTIAPKLSILKHLRVKNQDRQRQGLYKFYWLDFKRG